MTKARKKQATADGPVHVDSQLAEMKRRGEEICNSWVDNIQDLATEMLRVGQAVRSAQEIVRNCKLLRQYRDAGNIDAAIRISHRIGQLLERISSETAVKIAKAEAGRYVINTDGEALRLPGDQQWRVLQLFMDGQESVPLTAFARAAFGERLLPDDLRPSKLYKLVGSVNKSLDGRMILSVRGDVVTATRPA